MRVDRCEEGIYAAGGDKGEGGGLRLEEGGERTRAVRLHRLGRAEAA